MSPALSRLSFAAVVLAALACVAATPTPASQSSALWRVVHDLCVTDMKVSKLPAPCVAVNLHGRYAVLKDIRGPTQLLLIPTDRISGIESPALLAPASPNYWQDAWDARPLFDKGVGRPVPREDLGLAINSPYGRTQNQLHIHIDCVKPSVRDVLQFEMATIGDAWKTMDVTFSGHHYRVRRLMGADLGERNPFKLLAAGDPDARADMSHETLVVIGAIFADGQPGFFLLSDHADLTVGNQGAGEELLDHKCRVLEPPAKPS
jgi:CDP-diacylglycerol pyrophosphatase